MRLTVHTEAGQPLTVDVSTEGGLPELRRKLEELTGADRLSYGLYCDNQWADPKNIRLSCDTKLLWVRRRWVWVQIEGREALGLSVWPDATVRYVKEQIQEDEKIPVELQVLKFNGMELHCDQDKVLECGLSLPKGKFPFRQEGNTLHLSLRTTREMELMVAQGPVARPDSKTSSNPQKHNKLLSSINVSMPELELQMKCQELSGQCEILEINNKFLTQVTNNLRQENQQIKDDVSVLRAQVSSLLSPEQGYPKGSLREKLFDNFTQFLRLDLDIADYLLEEKVLSRWNYEDIIDSQRFLARRKVIKEVLLIVGKSEENVRKLRVVLLRMDCSLHKELAELLN